VRDGRVDGLILRLRPRSCRRAGAPRERSRIRDRHGARPTRRPRADLAGQRRQHVPALGARALDRVRHALLARPRLSRCQHRYVDGRDALDLPEERPHRPAPAPRARGAQTPAPACSSRAQSSSRTCPASGT
jgi:hypothetical protein